MIIKQISVFLENKSGRLAEVSRILGNNEINISALSIADTTDFGILRIIVNKPELAENILKENGFAVKCTEVIAVTICDKPGGLADVLEVIKQSGIGIEYLYAFVGKITEKAMVILRVDQTNKAIESLEEHGVKVLESEEVYDL